MTIAAWIFMISSVSSVTLLTIWCFKRVLSTPKPPPEQSKEFHSA